MTKSMNLDRILSFPGISSSQRWLDWALRMGYVLADAEEKQFYRPRHPRAYATLADLPVEALQMLGIKGLILDIGDVVMYHGTNDFLPGAVQKIWELRKSGIVPVGLTNSRVAGRVEVLNDDLGMQAFYADPLKPVNDGEAFKRPLIYLQEYHGVAREETGAIGNHMRDVYGANKAGIVTLYVKSPRRELFGSIDQRIMGYHENGHKSTNTK